MTWSRLALVVLVACTACVTVSSTVTPPPRPKGLPAHAVWAGGPDGGSFIACTPSTTNDEKDPLAYDCEIFLEHTGEREAHGLFVVRDVAWDEQKREPVFTIPSTLPQALVYSAWDGTTIHLDAGRALLPHGTIAYPLARKIQRFDAGRALGEEETVVED